MNNRTAILLLTSGACSCSPRGTGGDGTGGGSAGSGEASATTADEGGASGTTSGQTTTSGRLEVRSTASYCAVGPGPFGDLSFSLAREQKFVLRFPEAVYEIPEVGIDEPVPMRIDGELSNAKTAERFDLADGSLAFEGDWLLYEATIAGAGGGEPWSLLMELEAPPPDGTWVLDDPYDPRTQLQTVWGPEHPLRMFSCLFDSPADHRLVRIEFDGGNVELDWRADWWRLTGQGPAAVMRAEGTLDGTPFVVDRYEDLLYFSPDLANLVQNIGITFTEPIGPACALTFSNLFSAAPTVAITDCDFVEVEPRSFISVDVEVL